MVGPICATLNHQFLVSDIEKAVVNERLDSPLFDVVHNDVTLQFRLQLRPKDSGENEDHMQLYVMYEDGPKTTIHSDFELFVVNGVERWSLHDNGPASREFVLSDGGWGFAHALPRSLKVLTDDGKILHIVAELSIKESAFVHPLQISISLGHKFDVQQILDADPGYEIVGSVVSVAHNNVKLDFNLYANTQEQGTGNGRIGFYVGYLNGPNNSIELDTIDLIVVKDRKRHSIMHERNDWIEKGGGYGIASLPRTFDALSTGGYLSSNNKLYVIAELSIPESAFQATAEKPDFVQVDSHGFYLSQEITIPPTIGSINRVELVTKNDGGETHLWAHREILSSASDVFKDLLDPNKPEDAKLDCFKQGVMHFDDLSGDALKQMMHFIYLQQTDKEFESFALEIVPVVDRFLIKGLKEACERSLIDAVDLMSIDSLICCLKDSYTCSLTDLTAACVEAIPPYIGQNNDVEQEQLESLIKLAEQHGHATLKSACELKLANILDNTAAADRTIFLSLLSLGRKHQLEVLTTHCVRWFKNNFAALNANGIVRALMDDNNEDVIVFLFESMVALPLP